MKVSYSILVSNKVEESIVTLSILLSQSKYLDELIIFDNGNYGAINNKIFSKLLEGFRNNGIKVIYIRDISYGMDLIKIRQICLSYTNGDLVFHSDGDISFNYNFLEKVISFMKDKLDFFGATFPIPNIDSEQYPWGETVYYKKELTEKDIGSFDTREFKVYRFDTDFVLACSVFTRKGISKFLSLKEKIYEGEDILLGKVFKDKFFILAGLGVRHFGNNMDMVKAFKIIENIRDKLKEKL